MKKTIVIVTLWLLIIGYAYSQSASRGNYYPIDPYDYKLSIESAKPGIARLYKSTVLFSMQMGTNFYFKSLDGSTTLSMEAKKRFQPMNDGQKVTIYYTATRSPYVALDTVILDDIDY
ncbi:MAG TPA: hypothetical protein PLW63_09170 [Bacillota bacterium]|nr:hypothetical protein [Bacillota bacterium]